MTLTAERLRELFHYNQETGVFTRRVSVGRHGSQKAGNVAGGNDGRGYHRATVDGRKFRVHQLAWLYVHGVFPSCLIDHINGDKADNRISNLRPATKSQNGQNQHGIRSCNTSGATGIHWDKRSCKWHPRITVDYKVISLGLFNNLHEAIVYRALAQVVYHPFRNKAAP